jgi:uncharacterized protein YlzI (FlbEa/FlbD family)
MFQKLSSTSNRILWVNTDHIVSMEKIPVEKGYPSTNILFSNGGSELVHESPDDIMTAANRGPDGSPSEVITRIERVIVDSPAHTDG